MNITEEQIVDKMPEEEVIDDPVRRIHLKIDAERIGDTFTVGEFLSMQEKGDFASLIKLVSLGLWNPELVRFYTQEEAMEVLKPLTINQLRKIAQKMTEGLDESAIPKVIDPD